MQKGILTIAFDDGYLDTYKYAIPYLDKAGIKCTFAVPAGLIGKTCENRPVVKWVHLKGMKRKGHEIASHTMQHVNFKIQDTRNKIQTNFKFQISNSKQILQHHLKNSISSFVYPFLDKPPGKFIQNIVKKNYSSSRISKNFPVFNKIAVRNPYRISGFCIMQKRSLAYLEKQVEHAIQNNLWLIEVFHLVGMKNTKSAHRNAPYRFFMHINDFKRHIDFILSRDIKIMTQSEVAGKYA